MSVITTHVLDTASGQPARGVHARLFERTPDGGDWRPLAQGTTDDDGRIGDLLPAGAPIEPGPYRLRFATGDYFATRGIESFHPEVDIVFTVREPQAHHHVPLLLSPFGYTTYRGS